MYKVIQSEILVKYMPVANNHLVDLLESEGAEAVVPDLAEPQEEANYITKKRKDLIL